MNRIKLFIQQKKRKCSESITLWRLFFIALKISILYFKSKKINILDYQTFSFCFAYCTNMWTYRSTFSRHLAHQCYSCGHQHIPLCLQQSFADVHCVCHCRILFVKSESPPATMARDCPRISPSAGCDVNVSVWRAITTSPCFVHWMWARTTAGEKTWKGRNESTGSGICVCLQVMLSALR